MIAIAVALLLAQATPDQVRFQAVQKLAAEGLCAESIPALRELAAAHPTVAAIGFLLGQCLFETSDYAGTAIVLQKVAAQEPGFAEVYYYLGSALGMSGKIPEGIEQLTRAVDVNPEFGAAHRVLGMFRVESGQMTPETRIILEHAVKLEPEDARSEYWLGRYYLAARDYEAARQHLSRSLQLHPESPQTRVSLGQAMLEMGDSDPALEQFSAVLQHQPDNVDARIGQARCLYAGMQFEQALIDAEGARRKASGAEQQRAALWISSRIYRALGRPVDAEAAEKELLVLDRQFTGRLNAFRKLQEEAMSRRAAGDTAGVIRALTEGLAIEERQDSLVMLGDVYAETGRLADAERCYVRAGQVGPASDALAERLLKLRERMRVK
ncbi:MAG: tetratricopeptide repeat protein [Candidatus Solibacter sp.]|nr:tetratricopeptide repeat protein [Candidatus Solibacter sp.]